MDPIFTGYALYALIVVCIFNGRAANDPRPARYRKRGY